MANKHPFKAMSALVDLMFSGGSSKVETSQTLTKTDRAGPADVAQVVLQSRL